MALRLSGLERLAAAAAHALERWRAWWRRFCAEAGLRACERRVHTFRSTPSRARAQWPCADRFARLPLRGQLRLGPHGCGAPDSRFNCRPTHRQSPQPLHLRTCFPLRLARFVHGFCTNRGRCSRLRRGRQKRALDGHAAGSRTEKARQEPVPCRYSRLDLATPNRLLSASVVVTNLKLLLRSNLLPRGITTQ